MSKLFTQDDIIYMWLEIPWVSANAMVCYPQCLIGIIMMMI